MTDETGNENELCCPPDCCDMRGFLTFQILWELGKEALTGQQIAEKIAERRGTKPTPGTIYPALANLRGEGYIEGHQDGREIFYRLTESGKEARRESACYFYQAFAGIIEECKVLVLHNGECNKC